MLLTGMDGNGVSDQSQARQEWRSNLAAKAAKSTETSWRYIPTQQHKPKPTTTQVRRYRERDAHEVFFRTGGARPKQKVVKRTKPMPRSLIGKQRALAAKEHWEMHHGNEPKTSPKWASPALRPNSGSDSRDFRDLGGPGRHTSIACINSDISPDHLPVCTRRK